MNCTSMALCARLSKPRHRISLPYSVPSAAYCACQADQGDIEWAASNQQEGRTTLDLTWLAGPLPSERAVLDVVSAPSSEKRSQSEDSSSQVQCEGENVDAPSWVNSLAVTADAAEPACIACLQRLHSQYRSRKSRRILSCRRDQHVALTLLYASPADLHIFRYIQ